MPSTRRRPPKKRPRLRVAGEPGDPLRYRFAKAPSDVVLEIIRSAWLLYAADPTPENLDRVLHVLDWDACVRDPDYVRPETMGRQPPLTRVLDGLVEVTDDDRLYDEPLIPPGAAGGAPGNRT